MASTFHRIRVSILEIHSTGFYTRCIERRWPKHRWHCTTRSSMCSERTQFRECVEHLQYMDPAACTGTHAERYPRDTARRARDPSFHVLRTTQTSSDISSGDAHGENIRSKVYFTAFILCNVLLYAVREVTLLSLFSVFVCPEDRCQVPVIWPYGRLPFSLRSPFTSLSWSSGLQRISR